MAQDRFDAALDEFESQTDSDESHDAHDADDDWSEGDVCGQGGCEKEVHERHFPRDPDSDVPAHESYSEFEYVCVHHGIVATT
jgi:hypothetical protein